MRGDPAAGFWRLLFQTSRDAVIAVDARGHIVQCNPAALTLFGYRDEDIAGHPVTVLVPSFAREPDPAAADDPRHDMREASGRHHDGTEFPVEIMVIATRTAGEPFDLIIIRDITRQESTVRVAREVEERFKAFMDHAPAVAFIKDRQGRYLYVNRRYEDLYRTPLAELYGRTDFDLRPSAIAEQLQVNDQAVLNEHHAMEFLETVPVADDVPRNWLVFKFPLSGADGESLLGGMAIDITEQRQAERRLAMQYAVTQAMTSALGANDALANLLPRLAQGTGWALGEIWLVDNAGATLRRAHAWHDPRLNLGEFEDASRKTVFGRGDGVPGRVWESCRSIFCADLRTDSGFQRRVLADSIGLRVLHAFPIVHGGEVLGVIVFYSRFAVMPDRDLHLLLEAIGKQIGEFMQNQRNAERIRDLEREGLERQHQAAIGAVTAQIVHDLGNPLAGLSLMAHTLLRDIERDPNGVAEPLLPLSRRIVDAVAYMDRVLLDLSHFVRGRGLALRPTNISELLRKACDLWEFRATESGLTIQLEVPGPQLMIRADADQLQRVFDNLLKNAIEASEIPGGVIRVAAEEQPDRVRVSVADVGCGIPDGVNIFGLFETTKPGGTGLGLPICRQILAKHGGNISFVPAAPHGTVFHVDLPVDGPPRIS